MQISSLQALTGILNSKPFLSNERRDMAFFGVPRVNSLWINKLANGLQAKRLGISKEQLDKGEVTFSEDVLNVVDVYLELPNFNPTSQITHMVNSLW